MVTSIAVAFVVSVALSSLCLRAVTRAERAGFWPDDAVMIAGSTAIWVIVPQTMWMLA